MLECKDKFLAPGKHDKYLKSIAHNYAIAKKAFATRNTIMAMNEDEMFNALNSVNSFHDFFRFHQGGIEGARRDFSATNSPDSVKKNTLPSAIQ